MPETASYDAVTEAQLRTRACSKWQHYPEHVLPLWVADMDFPVADPIKAAIVRQIESDALGYGPKTGMPDLRESLVDRLAERHGWTIGVDDVYPLAGVMPGLYLSAQVLAAPRDEIVIQPPVYPPFASTISHSGRVVRDNPMLETGGGYRFDLDGLREVITPATRALVLCNPQNPTGRVFTREELVGLAEVVLEHRLWVVSDELHADLVLDGTHVPFASLSQEIAQRTVTLYGPSKAFNVSGLKIGFAIAQNPVLLERLKGAGASVAVGPTPLSQQAAIAAFRHGDPWLRDTLAYIRANRDHLVRRLGTEAPEIRVRPPEGTYLAWLDMRSIGLGDVLEEALLAAGVGLNPGRSFGPGGEGFARLNLATSRAILDAALGRLVGLARDPGGARDPVAAAGT